MAKKKLVIKKRKLADVSSGKLDDAAGADTGDQCQETLNPTWCLDTCYGTCGEATCADTCAATCADTCPATCCHTACPGACP